MAKAVGHAAISWRSHHIKHTGGKDILDFRARRDGGVDCDPTDYGACSDTTGATHPVTATILALV